MMRGKSAKLLIAVLVVIAAHGLLWTWGVRRLQSGYESWVAAQTAQGWTITAAAPRYAGWPLAAELVLPNAAISGGKADLPAGIAWTAASVSLSVALLHPATLTVAASGPQTLRIGATPALPFTASTERLDIPFGSDPSGVVEIDQLDAGTLTAGRLHLQGTFHPDARADQPVLPFSLAATDLGLPPLPPGQVWPLGPKLASFAVDGALNGPLPPQPPRPAPQLPFADLAAKWRDGGGTLELSHFALAWTPLEMSGSASLGFDDHMQPKGTGTASITNPTETIDALVASHVVAPRAALAAQAVLGLLAHAPPGGGPPEVDVPAELNNGMLSVGRIPLARFPQLVWPDRN